MKSKRKPRLLILVPTTREKELLYPNRRPPLPVAIVGIGLARAGVEAAQAIARERPDAIVLVGLAGTLKPELLPVGWAVKASDVACEGIGAGEARRFVSFEQAPLELAPWCSTRIAMQPPIPPNCRAQLLSVAAAADSSAMAAARRRRHPRALAEEMEGFAVALAAEVARVPLAIVRGVSNVAGERETRRWLWREPLAECRELIDEWRETAGVAP